MIINLFLTCAAYAEKTDMQVYFDNQRNEYGSSVEKVDDDYYMLYYQLTNRFNYREGDGEILISRYGTELKITFGSDIISVNGKAEPFTKPVYNNNDQNYISLRLIAYVFGSDININENDSTIKITLNEKPVLPAVNAINGSITLPNDEVAPASGIAFRINANCINVYTNSSFKYVIIESGKNSANYEMPIASTTETYNEYVVSYEILDSYQYDTYSSYGYYSYGGTRSNYNKASSILLTESSFVNLSVIKNRTLLGTVNRNGYDNSLYIYTFSDGYGNQSNVNDSKFSISIPSDIERLYLQYYLNGKDSTNFVYTGYYNKNGSSPFYDYSNYINMNTDDISNIQIDILKGKVITGTVNFPESSSNKELWFNLTGEINNNYTQDNSFFKPVGSTQVEYRIVVPIYDNNKYILSYSQNRLSGYVTSAGKISSEKTLAREIDITTGDSFTQDIFIEQPKIYGTISLPNDELAPSGGMGVKLTLNGDDAISVTATIPQGENSINYELIVPNEILNNYEILLDYSALGGRYSSSQSLYSYNLGTSQQMDVTLNKMSKVSGAISLPENEVAEKDLEVTINASGNFHNYSNVTIPQGKTSTEYSIMVNSNSSYLFSYNITNAEEYLNGYYSENGTVINYWEGKKFNITDDISNINMQTSKVPYISGTISLPQNMSALTEDLSIELIPYFNAKTIILPKGEVSVPYKVYVQARNLNDVNYFQYYLTSNTHPNLWLNGYYTSKGMYSKCIPEYLMFSGDKAENINITLVKSIEITGKIKLPDNNLAKNDIDWDVSVIANGEYGSSANSNATTKLGDNECSYKLNIPEDNFVNGYKLKYYSYNCPEYYNFGYYNVDGATSQKDRAGIIKNQDNLEMTVINKNTINGTITKAVNSADQIMIDVNAASTEYPNNYEDTKHFNVVGKNSFNYSLDIPVDVPSFNVRYYIYGTPGSAMFKNNGYYNSSQENNLTFDNHQAQALTVSDNPVINFTIPLSSTDNYPLALDRIYDVNNNYFDIRDSVYNTKNFTIKAVNKTQEDTESTIFVSRYDKNNKLIEVVSKKTILPKLAMSDIVLKFRSDRLDETDKIKIIAWDTNLCPLAEPKIFSELLE